MKRTIAFPLYALLLVLCLLPCAALAAQDQNGPDQLFGSALIDNDIQVGSMAWGEDTLYILTSRQLYAWKPGDPAARMLSGVAFTYTPTQDEEAASLHALVSHQGQVLGLDGKQGVLYRLTHTDGAAHLEEKMTLDWSPFQQVDAQNPYVELPAFVTVAHGRLYVRVNNYDNKAVDLYSYHLETGDMKQHAVTLLQDIVPYKDGQLLALRFDQNKMDPETMQQLPPELLAVNPQDDTFEPLPLQLPGPGKHGWAGAIPLWYDQAGDAVYTLSGGQMLRLTQGEPQPVALLQADSMWGRFGPAVVPYQQDLVFIRTNNNVLIRSTDPSNLGEVVELTINNEWLDHRALSLTLMELGNVRLTAHGWTTKRW